MSIEVREATADDWSLFREVRLQALADSPGAFASKLEDERDRPESAWRDRLASESSSCTFFAIEQRDVVGIVVVFLVPDDPSCAHLVSMWVAPDARRTGTATAMVESVLDWSRLHAAERVELWVTERNEPARRLYDRCGFVPSGKRQPLPSDPSVEEIQMLALLT